MALNRVDYNHTFIVVTDASNEGLGLVLLQEDDQGTERPGQFHSRRLNGAESNYSATEKKLLSFIWDIKKCRPHTWRDAGSSRCRIALRYSG